MSEKLAARITPQSLTEIVGIHDNGVRNTNTATVNTSRFTKQEAMNFFKSTAIPDRTRQQVTASAQSITDIFRGTHEEIASIMFDAEKLKVLAPEINQAASIRVSSILSPNDLQDGLFKCTLDNVSGLEEETKAAVATYLTDYFNNVLELGINAEEWIKQCLFGAGSVPLFIFPSTQFKAFRKDGLRTGGDGIITIEGYDQRQRDLEESRYYSLENKERILNTKIYTQGKVALESLNTVFKQPATLDQFYNEVYTDLASVDEVFFSHTDNTIPSDIKTVMESIRVTLTKELEEGDSIRLTENPEIIKFAGEYRNKNKKDIQKSFDESIGKSVFYNIDELVSLQKYENNEETSLGHPFFMVLPPESVCPIIVPGNPREHLGYICLIDDFGHPLRGIDRKKDSACSGGSVSAAYNAMFGGTCGSVKGLGTYTQVMTDAIFDHLLDQYIKAKLKNIGHDNVDIKRSNAIAQVMFHRILEHKRTTLVFIPSHLMTYLCYDYREDGTGKSLLEEIQFILSLRATFMVASVMAMANDSINHHTLELTFDEKTANPEQLMDLIANRYIDKRRMQLSIDPTDIATNIARNSLTIVPKGLPGLNGFEINPSVQGGTSVKTDNDMMDTFASMATSAYGVPHSALNQLGESEYSRSVATTNLFFSKQTKRDQRTTCSHMAHFAKTYIRYSPTLQKGILDILESKGRVNDAVPHGIRSDTKTAQPKQTKASVLLARIIDGFAFTLPIPNVAADKAQFEELRAFMDSMTAIADTVFSEELISADDAATVSAMRIIKAHWKREWCQDYFNSIGSFNTLKVPSIDDLGLKQLEYGDIIQGLMNLSKHFENVKNTFSAAEPDSYGGDSGGGFGGMGDDTGGMDDGMGDDSDGMGDDAGYTPDESLAPVDDVKDDANMESEQPKPAAPDTQMDTPAE